MKIHSHNKNYIIIIIQKACSIKKKLMVVNFFIYRNRIDGRARQTSESESGSSPVGGGVVMGLFSVVLDVCIQ